MWNKFVCYYIYFLDVQSTLVIVRELLAEWLPLASGGTIKMTPAKTGVVRGNGADMDELGGGNRYISLALVRLRLYSSLISRRE